MRTRRARPAAVPRSAFAGFRFPPDVIVLAGRWYLRFALSYRDVEELLAKRGIEVDHVTIYRWVLRFTPLLADAARPCRHAVGDRWQVDETYVKVAGRWHEVYRAIDQFGQVIDVFVSARRDATAAHRSSSGQSGRPGVTPIEVTTDRQQRIRRCSMTCCRRRGIGPSRTPTTASMRPRPAAGAATAGARTQPGRSATVVLAGMPWCRTIGAATTSSRSRNR